MLKAGTLSDFDGSMAEAIEAVFDELWNGRHEQPLPGSTKDDRRMLYIAVAQGVISHLQEHAHDGFAVTVGEGQGTVDILVEQPG